MSRTEVAHYQFSIATILKATLVDWQVALQVTPHLNITVASLDLTLCQICGFYNHEMYNWSHNVAMARTITLLEWKDHDYSQRILDLYCQGSPSILYVWPTLKNVVHTLQRWKNWCGHSRNSLENLNASFFWRGEGAAPGFLSAGCSPVLAQRLHTTRKEFMRALWISDTVLGKLYTDADAVLGSWMQRSLIYRLHCARRGLDMYCFYLRCDRNSTTAFGVWQ